jgi:YbgC/YbaW family acyl-CoA thioester hydrolase
MTLGEGHLAGIRVLDVSRYTPGGYCTMLLADAGADVIKIEQPEIGDSGRWTNPRAGAHGIPFYTVNRNKRSVEIDLRSAEGQDEMHRLVEGADVVLETFRPGVATRLGIAPEQLQAVNPSIISCSISGYGQTGPLRGRPGHDINYLARAGVLARGRDEDGGDAPPVLSSVWISDYAAGLMAAFAIVTALAGRQRTGLGEVIDIGMADVMTQWLGDQLGAARDGGAGQAVDAWPSSGQWPGYGFYRTRDGRYMAAGAEEEAFWRGLCERLGKPELADSDPLSAGDEGRRVRAALAEVFATRTRAEWEEVFSDDLVPIDPVLDLNEAGAAEQVAAREMLVTTETVEGDPITIAGFPIKYDRAPGAERLRSPALGEHNDKIDSGATRGRAGAVFEHRLRVRYDEADIQGVVHNPRYLAYADIALIEWWRVLVGSLAAANEAGVDVMLAESHVRYLRSAFADDVLDLRLRVLGLGEGSMNVETQMYRGEELLTVADMHYVFVDPLTLQPTPIKAEWRPMLERYMAPDDLPAATPST